ncbi:MAG: NifU family protein [Maioricimonas sp. JB049]
MTAVTIRSSGVPSADGPPSPEQVAEVVDYIRPAVMADGGDISLVAVDDDGTVTVEFSGACVGCPISEMTLKVGVERILVDRVPGVTAVRSLTTG